MRTSGMIRRRSRKGWYSIVIIVALMLSIYTLSKWLFFEQKREILITIDDLPFYNSNVAQAYIYMENLTKHLLNYKAPAIGFVIANRVSLSRSEQLRQFLN